MKVYHGSWMEVSNPDLKHSRPDVDFGRGFYTTSIKDQAVKWCGRFKRRGQSGIISCYEFDESASDKLNVRNFESYSEEWLDFILSCRRERDTSNYDIVMGGVANDKVFNTVELYFEHLIDKKEAINRLRYEKPNIQICFRTEDALRLLHYEGERQSMNANPILLQKKYVRIIELFANRKGISLDASLDFFYHSQVYQLMREGVSDMHCMSDGYLADELEMEYEEENHND